MMLISIVLAATLATGSFSGRNALQKDLQTLAEQSDGKVGICALETTHSEAVCVHGNDPFPLQSVMKMIVAAAALDQVDAKTLRLDEIILVKPEHFSPGPEEFAALVRKKGEYPATVEELMRRSIVDSDSTSVDRLIERLGGIGVVQDFIRRKGLAGLRIDRNERDLQSEFYGLRWTNAYAAAGQFDAAVNAVPAQQREAAIEAYLKDPRDTATPRGMVHFLKTLASGQLLSAASTRKLLSIMEMTATGKDRLRAGLPKGWGIGHKTGTSGSWKDRFPTTNDTGVLTAPDGGTVAIAVFIADSRRPNAERAAVIAKAARLVTGAYRTAGRKS